MRFLRSFILSAFVGIAALGVTISSSQAMPILIIDNGQLLGADNLDLGRLGLFDVRFVEGTCADLFSGCDNVADDFDFQNTSDASFAAAQILDQVLLDIGNDLFDSDPELTNGCEDVNLCFILVPFAINANPLDGALAVRFALNFASGPTEDDRQDDQNRNILLDTTSDAQRTFAKFSPAAATQVPEPSIVLVFGLGVIGLAVSRRRRRFR